MEKATKEKSLVKVNNNFFTKMKRFWRKLVFSKKNKLLQANEKVENTNGVGNANKVGNINKVENTNQVEVTIETSSEQKLKGKGKLFDYDKVDEDNNTNANEAQCKTEGNNSQLNSNSNIGQSNLDVHRHGEASGNNANEGTMYKTVEVDNNGVDLNVTYLFEKNEKAEPYEGKEEIERKLINYYKSIKNPKVK